MEEAIHFHCFWKHIYSFCAGLRALPQTIKTTAQKHAKVPKNAAEARKTTKRNVKRPRVDTPTKKRAPQLYTLGTLGFQGASPFSCSVWFFGTLDVPGQRVISYHSAGKGLQHHGQVVQLFLRSILSGYCTEWIDTRGRRKKKNI